MDTESLKAAGIIIKKKFGDISDLPEELQNTIANIYYHVNYLAKNRNNFFGTDFKHREKRLKNSMFYFSSAQVLPEIISGFRDVVVEGNKQVIQCSLEYILNMYKYRMISKNLLKLPIWYVRIWRFFSRSNVDEIPDLYLKIVKYCDNTPLKKEISENNYETFEQWYYTYKQVAGSTNPQLKINEEGNSLLDWMENEPLKKAFQQGLDPRPLAIDFAKQFDCWTFGQFGQNEQP